MSSTRRTSPSATCSSCETTRPSLRRLGQNSAQAVEKQVAHLTNPTLSATDTRALVEDFRRAMQQDLGRLYDELKLGAVKTLLSKEAAVAIAAPLAGAPR